MSTQVGRVLLLLTLVGTIGQAFPPPVMADDVGISGAIGSFIRHAASVRTRTPQLSQEPQCIPELDILYRCQDPMPDARGEPRGPGANDPPPAGVVADIAADIGVLPGLVASPIGDECRPPGVAWRDVLQTPVIALPGSEMLNMAHLPRQGRYEMATAVVICLLAFAPNQEVLVRLELPNGTTSTGTVGVDDKGTQRLIWYALPGEPYGEYRVIAGAERSSAQASFTVRQASSPKILVLPRSGEPGTVFRIALAGFQSSSTVRLHLYRQSSDLGRLRYATTLLPARVNQQGEGIFELRTKTGDPEAMYCLMADPSSQICPPLSKFTLHR